MQYMNWVRQIILATGQHTYVLSGYAYATDGKRVHRAPTQMKEGAYNSRFFLVSSVVTSRWDDERIRRVLEGQFKGELEPCKSVKTFWVSAQNKIIPKKTKGDVQYRDFDNGVAIPERQYQCAVDDKVSVRVFAFAGDTSKLIIKHADGREAVIAAINKERIL